MFFFSAYYVEQREIYLSTYPGVGSRVNYLRARKRRRVPAGALRLFGYPETE